MRLYYHDHVPHDYEPPMFKAGEDDRLYLPDSPVKIKVGDVLTPHHTYGQLPLHVDARMLHPSNPSSQSFCPCKYRLHMRIHTSASNFEETDSVVPTSQVSAISQTIDRSLAI